MDQFAGLATSTFEATTGISPLEIASFATSSVLRTFIGSLLQFGLAHTAAVVSIGMILMCFLMIMRAAVFTRF